MKTSRPLRVRPMTRGARLIAMLGVAVWACGFVIDPAFRLDFHLVIDNPDRRAAQPSRVSVALE